MNAWGIKYLEDIGMIEFFARSFDGDWEAAKYRSSFETVSMGDFNYGFMKFKDLRIPKRLEVFSRDKEWLEFPQVFKNYFDYQSSKEGNGDLSIFFSRGGLSHPSLVSFGYKNFSVDPELKELYSKSESLGFTRASHKTNVMPFKEPDF